jgi:hypothetical protein
MAEMARRMFMRIGDEEKVAWVDAYWEASAAGLSVYACAAAGSIAVAFFRGLNMLQWQTAYTNENGYFLPWLFPAIEELRRADLLPWTRSPWVDRARPQLWVLFSPGLRLVTARRRGR